MSISALIPILIFDFGVPNPDFVPNLNICQATYSTSSRSLASRDWVPYSRAYLDTVVESATSGDGRKTYILRRQGVGHSLELFSPTGSAQPPMRTELVKLISVSHSGEFACGYVDREFRKRAIQSMQTGQLHSIPDGTFLTSDSGSYLIPRRRSNSGFVATSDRRAWVALSMAKIIAQLRTDFGLSRLDQAFLSAHPELQGAYGQCVYSEVSKKGEFTLIYNRKGLSYKVGKLYGTRSPYAVLFAQSDDALIARTGDKFQVLAFQDGKLSDTTYWLDAGRWIGWTFTR